MLKSQMKKLPRQGAVKIYPDGREICLDRAEYKGRTLAMHIRQKGLCAICGKWMETPTFDHECSRSGGKRDDRILVDGNPKNAAVHDLCNRLKGSKRYKWQGNKYLQVTKFQEVA